MRRSEATAANRGDGGDMTRKHPRLAAALGATLCAALAAAACAPAALSSAALSPGALSSAAAQPAGGPSPAWQPCPDNPGVSCGSVSLPVDWSNPDGPRFDMAVAKRAATNPVGTLVYLPAGPGSSGVDSITDEQVFPLVVPPAVAERFDVVSFDPRGVRRSNPVHCDAALVAKVDVPTPRDQTEYAALLDAQAALGADCRQRTGPLFDHLSSTDTARDVDGLRRSLGVPKLDLYGLSYGTVVGQMYAERFPNRIRTMTLDAVFDHSVDSDRFAVAGARAAQESFDRFVSWCDATAECVLHGTDIRATVAGIFARAADPDVVTRRIVPPLTQPNLPATAAAIVELTAAPAAPSSSKSEGLTPLPIYIQCADNVNRTRTFADAQRLAARERQVAPDVRGSAYRIASLCVNPPVPATNPQRPLTAHGTPPVLVMNSRYDASTPHEGARRVAGQLDGAVFVTYDGMGHGAANRTDCTRDVWRRYLIDRVLPADGAHCPAA